MPRMSPLNFSDALACTYFFTILSFLSSHVDVLLQVGRWSIITDDLPIPHIWQIFAQWIQKVCTKPKLWQTNTSSRHLLMEKAGPRLKDAIQLGEPATLAWGYDVKQIGLISPFFTVSRSGYSWWQSSAGGLPSHKARFHCILTSNNVVIGDRGASHFNSHYNMSTSIYICYSWKTLMNLPNLKNLFMCFTTINRHTQNRHSPQKNMGQNKT